MSIRIAPYRCRLRSAKSSTPSTSTLVVGGSGNARTIRSKVERPTETPSVDANLDPTRPASATRSSPRLRVAAEWSVRKPSSVR